MATSEQQVSEQQVRLASRAQGCQCAGSKPCGGTAADPVAEQFSMRVSCISINEYEAEPPCQYAPPIASALWAVAVQSLSVQLYR